MAKNKTAAITKEMVQAGVDKLLEFTIELDNPANVIREVLIASLEACPVLGGPKKRKADREERAWREKVEKRLADPAIKSVIRENHERAMRIKAGRKT